MSDQTKKEFDVALVDPHSPSVEHWPRMRVEIDAVSAADLPTEAPPANETVDQETARIAFKIRDAERQRAIDAYNRLYGLGGGTSLRYDVAEADPTTPAPVEPKRWADYRKAVGLA